MTNSINDVGNDAGAYLIIGSNTTENHPVIGYKIKNNVLKNGAKLIVADPRRTELAEMADLYLPMQPGSDVAVFNGLMHVIIRDGLAAADFIKERTENFEAFKDVVDRYTPEYAGAIAGLDPEDIVKAAHLFAEADAAAIVYAMGLTQHSNGTDHVLSAANLAMLTGNLGKPGAGVNPLRGQNNVQGACDMGGLPDVYTAYQKVENEEARAKFEKAWAASLPTKPGLKLTEAIDKAHHGELKALMVIGENPLVSDPDIHHLVDALDKLEFLMVSDIFLTETAQKADVVFPAACFAEKDGTFSNTERRVQRVRKAINPPGEAKADWELMCELAGRLGYPMQYGDPEEIFEEIRTLTPSYAGITYKRLEATGIQWPCPNEDHPGTPVMHKEKFTRGLGLFNPVEYKGPAEKPDTEYPYYLTTGRTLFHYHTGTMTRRSKALDQHYPEGLIEISPAMAAKLNFKNGEKAKLSTRRGSVEAPIHINDNLPEQLIFMTFHFAEAAANMLTNAVLDPVAKIPEYKVSAARLEKI